MTITFFSNNLNHHQVALCDELYSLCGDDFKFVELSHLDEERRKMGFNTYERPYRIKIAEDKSLAFQLAVGSDVAIMGAESFGYLKHRVIHSNGLTFSYSERWFKQGLKNILSPRLLKQILLYLTEGRRKPWYMLCASGFLARDLVKIGLFRHKCFKWGYFPIYDFSSEERKVGNRVLRILWVGRFIGWKHPELMVQLGKKLMESGKDFIITMIGDGPEWSRIESMIDSSLKDKLILTRNKPNQWVIDEMRSSDIFCFTSDRQEGWGAVLGEAMATGCCPVASSDAGATPFLIDNGKNGLVFKSGNLSDLYAKVSYLIKHPDQRLILAEHARESILSHWSATVAANNLVILSKAKLSGAQDPSFAAEPCEFITTKKEV